jgi:hypothetical protein
MNERNPLSQCRGIFVTFEKWTDRISKYTHETAFGPPDKSFGCICLKKIVIEGLLHNNPKIIKTLSLGIYVNNLSNCLYPTNIKLCKIK